ncbi:GNAT family N-acetyltransferase [Rhizobiales bacterium RZME27]|uniref:GNAT family N-acetyltransferase n=1 Tax=Endobacterium cereale TaxID=2663029 RepID=A0A6A8A9F4_9HYPH|nr:GNAT family N-acetyltransferase [Endobacterium cereale]MEB2843547.1 GNAT family N-acetyltransferase [Endobacterium cereale]MQY47349.1 GNAT family N-acetyltransferase [Endobacterium cereale]
MKELSQVSIRRAGPPDAILVRDIVRSAYAKWVPVIGREPMPMTVEYAEAIARNRIDLLEAGGMAVGLIETILRDDHLYDDHLYIENIAVRPECHGRGYGRHLLAHAEDIAFSAGQGEIRLLTNAAFAANVVLYEHCGYTVTHTEPFMGGTTLYLKKRLEGRLQESA